MQHSFAHLPKTSTNNIQKQKKQGGARVKGTLEFE